MTSPVSPYSHAHGLPDPIGSSNASQAAGPARASTVSGAAAPSGEAVTLTPDAQTSTDLLEAARAATGVDPQAVQSLKTQIQSGTYQVSPENLAASILAAVRETQS